jgi:hypothetical protein
VNEPQGGRGVIRRMHLGWADDGRVCLGGGPVRLRFSRQEAAELRDRLDELLAGAPDVCGCAPEALEPRGVPDDGRFGF